MSNQDDIPTPRVTGSWAVSIGRSKALIVRLERASASFRDGAQAYRSPNPIKRNTEMGKAYDNYAQTCLDNIFALEEMIKKFETWPNRPREEVEKERKPLLKYLDDITRETDALCALLGKSF